ncbi:MAG: type II CRISPR-associated endonuclease Cas1 [Aquirufa antheringensis]|nr:type II CRISPR-associated endonuclease Cas1 [Aquirufa antheringensis]
MEQLVISYPQEFVKPITIPIEDIGIIVIESLHVTITSTLLNKLLQYGVGIFCCDEQHMPSGLMLPLEGHTQQTERIRTQLDASLPLKKNLWQQTVSAKIVNQARVLHARCQEVENLMRWSREVQSGDQKNHEARAAVQYWSRLFPWDGFTRNPDGESPNHLLNYGYSILRGITARAIVSSGMLPMLGIFHKNKYNAFGLADDIMEPYRPFVDALVLELVDSGEDFNQMTKEFKIHLMSIMRTDVLIDGQKSPLMVAMSRTTSSLYDCYTGKTRKILYPLYV